MKRYLDIENNIKQFIEDYNRSYNVSKSSISLNIDTKICSNPETKTSIHRRSLSFNSINTNIWNKTIDSSTTLALHSSYGFKRSKSEADLVDFLNNKNCKYFMDESLSSYILCNKSKKDNSEKRSEQSFSLKNLFHRSCSTVEELLTQSAVSIVELFSATSTVKCKSDESNTTISSLQLQPEKQSNHLKKSKQTKFFTIYFSFFLNALLC